MLGAQHIQAFSNWSSTFYDWFGNWLDGRFGYWFGDWLDSWFGDWLDSLSS